jgi:hypothetical protein
MTAKVKVGDDFRVWWETGRKSADGHYWLARVLEVLPYTGKYPQFFTCVLVLEAPRTKRGKLEMAA